MRQHSTKAAGAVKTHTRAQESPLTLLGFPHKHMYRWGAAGSEGGVGGGGKLGEARREEVNPRILWK